MSMSTDCPVVRLSPHVPRGDKGLTLYVVYCRPLDFPDRYVVRRWESDKPTEQHWSADTLEEARAKVPSGYVCLARHPMDVASIAEVWL